jgi:dihydroflavonol-4-reductase
MRGTRSRTLARFGIGGAALCRRRTLVTGGSGFIGQHLVAALLERGDIVRVLDLKRPADHLGCEFVQGSILDRDAVTRAMLGMDCVYHLAAIPHLWTRDKGDFERINRLGTEVVILVAAGLRIRRFVHCSTEAVLLPLAGGKPASEENESLTVKDMAGDYTRSKFLAEQVALAAARSGMPVTIVNPSVPIGPGDGNCTPPTAMLSLLVHHPPLLMLDGILNLVDVRDVAQGMLLAEQRGGIAERYLLGGENITLRNLVKRVAELLGRRRFVTIPLPGFVALAAGLVSEWFADNVSHRSPVVTGEGVRLALRSAPFDITKARTELGYSPRPIAKSLPDAVSWLSGAAAGREGAAGDWTAGLHQARTSVQLRTGNN